MKSYSETEIKEMSRLYKQRVEIKDIAKKLHTTYSRVYSILVYLNIHIPLKDTHHSKRRKLYYVSKEYAKNVKKWNDELKSVWESKKVSK